MVLLLKQLMIRSEFDIIGSDRHLEVDKVLKMIGQVILVPLVAAIWTQAHHCIMTLLTRNNSHQCCVVEERA
jgi:hypothetical protein